MPFSHCVCGGGGGGRSYISVSVFWKGGGSACCVSCGIRWHQPRVHLIHMHNGLQLCPTCVKARRQ